MIKEYIAGEKIEPGQLVYIGNNGKIYPIDLDNYSNWQNVLKVLSSEDCKATDEQINDQTRF